MSVDFDSTVHAARASLEQTVTVLNFLQASSGSPVVQFFLSFYRGESDGNNPVAKHLQTFLVR